MTRGGFQKDPRLHYRMASVAAGGRHRVGAGTTYSSRVRDAGIARESPILRAQDEDRFDNQHRNCRIGGLLSRGGRRDDVKVQLGFRLEL
jgi:hypothetical protein